MKERIMFICGMPLYGDSSLIDSLQLAIASFFKDENLKSEVLIEDLDIMAEKIIQNPNAAFIFLDTKVPGSIYNYFANDTQGIKMIQTYNITLGYLNMVDHYLVDKLVFCLNKTGKINVTVKAPKKAKTSRKRRVS